MTLKKDNWLERYEAEREQPMRDGIGMIDGEVVRFRLPDYDDEDFGPEVGSDA